MRLSCVPLSTLSGAGRVCWSSPIVCEHAASLSPRLLLLLRCLSATTPRVRVRVRVARCTAMRKVQLAGENDSHTHTHADAPPKAMVFQRLRAPAAVGELVPPSGRRRRLQRLLRPTWALLFARNEANKCFLCRFVHSLCVEAAMHSAAHTAHCERQAIALCVLCSHAWPLSDSAAALVRQLCIATRTRTRTRTAKNALQLGARSTNAAHSTLTRAPNHSLSTSSFALSFPGGLLVENSRSEAKHAGMCGISN